MSKFNIDKRGYDQQEVDSYINNLYLKYEDKLSEQKDRVFALKNELDKSQSKLNEYIEKDKQISKALIYAVEKADEIESGAKKIYELEIQRVRLLYKRWEELLIEVESRYPQLNTNNDVSVLLNKFKNSLEDVLQENFKLNSKSHTEEIKENLKNKDENNYIKNILNKMNYVFNDSAVAINQKPVVQKKVVNETISSAHAKENARLNSITTKFNRLSEITEKNSVMLSDFLNQEEEESFAKSAYAKNLLNKKKPKQQKAEDWPFNYAYPEPNESGFDLKEALNPKEDLNEIMKAFDFFEN